MITLYKYRPLHESHCDDLSCKMRERILDITNNKRLYCEKWVDFNDQHEGAYWALKQLPHSEVSSLAGLIGETFDAEVESLGLIRKAVDTRLRVCSLTKGPLNNSKLWEEYGDKHRGVAIEFELPGSTVSHPLYEITYQVDDKDSRGLRNIFSVLCAVDMDLNRISESLLTWKGRRYQFENEIRLICNQNELDPPVPTERPCDRLEMALYRLGMLEDGRNCYFDFRKLLKVRRVWCGRKIANDDFNFLKNNVVGIPVCRL